MNDIFNDNVPLKTETPAFAKHVLPAVPSSEVYLEDCVTALKRFNDNYFDLAIVDPPYGIGEDGGKQIEWKSRPNSIGKKPKYNKKNWDSEIPSAEYWHELFRVSKNQIVWGGNYFTEYLTPNGKWIVWDKLIEIPMFTSCELAWTSFKGNTIKRFKVHPFDKLNGGKDKQHPTQKPIKLYDWILQNYAKEGDLILDTHGGSMSSVIACLKGGYNITCFEIDREYYDKGKKRIEIFISQGDLFMEKPEIKFIDTCSTK